MIKMKIGLDGRVWKKEEGKQDLIIGIIEQDVYKCQRSANEHLHFVHNGWGLDSDLLNSLIDRGVKIIHIHDKFFDEHYYSELDMMKEFGVEEEYGTNGRQTLLSKKYWGTSPDYENKSNGFVHLHVHTEYSMLDGMGPLPELILKARRMGMNSLAITDHGNLFGIHKFHRFCKRVGIKPLMGCEFYVVDDVSVRERGRNHIVLIAKNKKGYKNLLKLSTLSNLEGFYYKPRIDKKMLAECNEGLIALSGCIAGRVSQHILNDELDRAKQHISWWKETFGNDYYIEIQPDKLEKYIKINPILIKLAKEFGVKIVSTNDVHYVEKSDKKAHDVLLGIQKKQTLKDKPGFDTDVYWFQGLKDIRGHFEQYHPTIHHLDFDEAIKNTQEVADKVEIFDIKGSYELPKAKSNALSFSKYSETESRSEYLDRFQYELGVIKSLGFENYFSLIAEIVSFAKSKGIQVGPGRGSVSGSLVSYWMGITAVDPIKHGLIFERFLNTSRRGAPDIDIDFDASRREEVLDYIRSKWKTSKISTYISIQGRGSIKDCCRVFGISYGMAEVMSKAFPARAAQNITIDKAILTEGSFKKFYFEYQEMFKVARRLEGRIKTVGLHPAGIIISDVSISDIVALRLSSASTGEPVVQCDMEDVDILGLLKFDCLGSKTQTTLSIAKELSGVKSLLEIPLDDKKIFNEFKKGNCWDIFQFQSELGHDTVMKVKPNDFETLTAITALIRPGAYDFIDDFTKGNYDPIIEALRPILKDTRNIILYQEQTMEIAVELAGFSLERADDLRKAIGKKKIDKMASLRDDFIEGGVSKGHSEKMMMQLFKIIERSSNYAFNKSHAVAYTLNSYWSMWFKVYHPVEWATAELSVQIEDEDKLKKYLEDTMRNGISILPPDINKSEWGFIKEENSVRCGLGMVKKFSVKGYAELSIHRPYETFLDFMGKTSGVKINKGAVQSLIKAGVFDGFGKGRRPLYDLVEQLKSKKKASSQDIILKDVEWTPKHKSKMEKEAMGFYISGHPILHYKEKLKDLGINVEDGLGETGERRTIKVAGIIDNIKKWKSKNGEMAFIDISGYEQYSINVWHNAWIVYEKHLSIGDMIVVIGHKLESRNKIGIEKGDSLTVVQ